MSEGINARDFLKGYDDAPVDQGGSFDALPKGSYHMLVERELRRDVSSGGAPRVSFLMRVLSGKYIKRTAIADFYLGAARVEQVYEKVNGKAEKVGEKIRSEAEFEEKNAKAQGRWKGFMSALGQPYRGTGEDLYDVMNVPGAVGNEVIGIVDVDKQNGNNKFTGFRSLDHPKEGLASVLAKEEKANATSTPATSRVATL